MNENLISQFTWTSFLTLFVGLLALFLLLQAALRLVQRTNVLGRLQSRFSLRLQQFILMYEPAAVFVATGAFVLINPVFHGLLVVLLLLSGFHHLKHYVTGRVIQFNNPFLLGKRMRTGQTEGMIEKMGRLGIMLETSEGLHFINYSNVQTGGYAILSGEEVGGVFQLTIRGETQDEAIRDPQHLVDQLATSPYVDWYHKPELLPRTNAGEAVQVRIWVQEEGHLYDLLELIKEWGYKPDIARN